MDMGKVALNTIIDDGDSGAHTLRDYFKEMLRRVFDEDEGFSGKRPFGNSGWQFDLAIHLIQSGVLDGSVKEDRGFVEDATYNNADYEKLIRTAIDSL